MTTTIIIGKLAERAIFKLPPEIVEAFDAWVESIIESGLFQTQRIPGYRDKQLKGKRKGQRSVRLSRGYRVFYTTLSGENVLYIRVLDINKHEY